MGYDHDGKNSYGIVTMLGPRRAIYSTVAIIGLAAVNGLLLRHRADIWKMFARRAGGPPYTMSTLEDLDRLRWLVGVLGFPLVAVILVLLSYSAVPLRMWTRGQVVMFMVALLALRFHLRWAHGWAREYYLDFPSIFVRLLGIMTYNTELYIAVVAGIVLLRWYLSTRITQQSST